MTKEEINRRTKPGLHRGRGTVLLRRELRPTCSYDIHHVLLVVPIQHGPNPTIHKLLPLSYGLLAFFILEERFKLRTAWMGVEVLAGRGLVFLKTNDCVSIAFDRALT
jgi:hypothetical protein